LTLDEIRVRGRKLSLPLVNVGSSRLWESYLLIRRLMHCSTMRSLAATFLPKQFFEVFRHARSLDSLLLLMIRQTQFVSYVQPGRERKARSSDAQINLSPGKFDLLGFKDLSFGSPIDWHLEPLSGKRAPLIHWSRLDYLNADLAGDKKIVWELNRHQYFSTLGQAYCLSGDEVLRRKLL